MTQQQKIVSCDYKLQHDGEYSILPVRSILDTGRLHKIGKTAQESG